MCAFHVENFIQTRSIILLCTYSLDAGGSLILYGAHSSLRAKVKKGYNGQYQTIMKYLESTIKDNHI